MRRLNIALSTKLNIIIIAAVLVPLMTLGFLMTNTLRSISLANLETFVEETGSRRQASIENDLRAALNEVNEFVNANQSLMAFSLQQQISTQSDSNIEFETLNTLETQFRSQLLESGYFTSIQMITVQFNPYNVVTRSDLEALAEPFSREAISTIAAGLDIDSGDTQVTGVTQADGDASRLGILTSILTEDTEGTRSVVGYLLAEIDQQRVFIQNLVREDTVFDTYAYVILPSTNQVIADAEILNANLVDTTSLGAQRALANRAATATTYNVGTEDAQREVVGYAASIVIDDQAFALITEVSTDALFTNITQQIVGQVFVYVVTATVVILLFSLLATNQLVLPPIRRIRQAVLGILRGDFDTPVPDVARGDELGALATSFVDMREYVRDQTEDMNRRLAARTRDVRVTQDISQAVTAVRDLDTLMSQVVNLIVQNFPSIYHAQIFLLDEENRYAVLRASTGAAGRELLTRGHKLAVGSVSVIGQVTEQAQIIIARDTAESTVHRQNEFLSATRAELAVPLSLGGTVIGALDVQSKQRDSFDDDQVAALQTLADQITIAIENTRLYAESERLLRETRAEQSRETRRAWQQYLYQQRQAAITQTAGTQTGYDFRVLRQKAAQTGKTAVGTETSRQTVPFVVPVRFREQTLGMVEYEIPAADFNHDKILLAEELVSRLAISLENARLFQVIREATERERIVNSISAKLTNQNEIEDILQTAVTEIEQALRTPRVAIRLKTAQTDVSNGNGHHNDNSNGNGNGTRPNGTP